MYKFIHLISAIIRQFVLPNPYINIIINTVMLDMKYPNIIISAVT